VLKQHNFVFWCPGGDFTESPPKLIIGTFALDNDNEKRPYLKNKRSFSFRPYQRSNDLWTIPVHECMLEEDAVYHYWFEVTSTLPYSTDDNHSNRRVLCTDPTAYATDWRLVIDDSAASVIRYSNSRLVPSDPESRPVTFEDQPDVNLEALPKNKHLVIYELPTAWSKIGEFRELKNVGVGTFKDVLGLLSEDVAATNRFVCKYLIELGVNALELLPPADSRNDRTSWGYLTTNYFAPDFDFGRPASSDSNQASSSVTDLLELIRACHSNGIRFFYDAAMASADGPYRLASFLYFHVRWGSGDPEQGDRDGFGGDLWKYGFRSSSPLFDPITGNRISGLCPARRHMIAHLFYWMHFYHIDGLRLNSLNNFGSWDFIKDVRTETRRYWNQLASSFLSPAEANERFLVVGKELSVPKELLSRIDGLWNEDFKRMVRRIILGQSFTDEAFDQTVRKVIDCRLLGFADGTQAVNYLGSHDGEGQGSERLFTYLDFNGIALKSERIKLAFVCLLTAVGIPMILAGDEFGDQHDLNIWGQDGNNSLRKQMDPVKYERLDRDVWRQDLFLYVSRLVKFRTSSDALSVNDTDFFAPPDYGEGKRVICWRRGRPGVDDPVVVVANFSDYKTPSGPGAEYKVPNFPKKPPGRRWREVTQDRFVPDEEIGREPISPWEAKVYTLI